MLNLMLQHLEVHLVGRPLFVSLDFRVKTLVKITIMTAFIFSKLIKIQCIELRITL